MKQVIRALPIYVNGKKIATVASGTYEILSGAKSELGLVDGYLGHKDGWPTTKIVPQVIVPVTGMQMAVESFLFDGIPFSVGIPANARVHVIEMRIVGISYKWDFKTGSCSGDLTFEGGQPTFGGSNNSPGVNTLTTSTGGVDIAQG